jgi:hypothetical protein
VVYNDPNEYGVETSDGQDYIMQTSPEKAPAR